MVTATAAAAAAAVAAATAAAVAVLDAFVFAVELEPTEVVSRMPVDAAGKTVCGPIPVGPVPGPVTPAGLGVPVDPPAIP